jgi:HD-GYP domain-containing protein (c-di-GMP phosphodiesterase class II)
MHLLRHNYQAFVYDRHGALGATFPKRWDTVLSLSLERLRKRRSRQEGELSSAVYIYISGLLWIASALVGWSLASGSHDWLTVLHIVLFASAIFLADLYPLRVPTRGNAEVTISCAFKTAVAIIYGPQVAVLTTLLGTAAAEAAMERKWYKAVFNISAMVLTSAGLSAVYYALSSAPRDPFLSAQNGIAVLALVITYFVINVGLVSVLMSLLSGANPFQIYRANLQSVFLNNLTIIPLGALIAHLWIYAPWTVLALGMPIAVAGKSFQSIGEFQEQTHRTLVRMADAIDERAPRTSHHARRVAAISRAIGKEMGLSEVEIERLSLTARLHDLGKIGMNDTLIHESENLDAREQEELSEHPIIGSKLLERFRFFKEGQEIVLHHHERYDGSGYPDGLAGDAIPLGSRIIALADAFERETHEAADSPSSNQKEALQQVLERSGSQFDPDVMYALVRVMEQHSLRSTLATLSPTRDRVRV